MTCSEAKLKLEPCASGTLPAEEKIALDEHLATCEGCRLELELTRAVLGSPAFDGAEESPPNHPEHAPVSADAPVIANTFEPPTAAEIDEEISFADLSLDEHPKPGEGVPSGTVTVGTGPTATPPAAVAGKKGAADSLWDFEPVDAHRDVGPPEGSLSFANEALTRKREEEQKRKATMLRLALWGGGIFGGVLLLGVSVWIALAFRQGNQNDSPPQPQGSNPAPTGTPAPGTVPVPTSTPSDSSTVAPTGAATSPVTTPDASATPPGAAATVPAPAATPGPEHVVQVPSTPDAQASATKKPTPKPATPKPVIKPTPKPAPRESHADDDEDATPAWTPSDLQPAPNATKPVQKPAETSPAPNATAPPGAGQTENPPPVAPQANP
ncbi:MAG: zf-HC2 domain-containing protein, partial [Candidatus Eiseniibacteriota bacterium]